MPHLRRPAAQPLPLSPLPCVVTHLNPFLCYLDTPRAASVDNPEAFIAQEPETLIKALKDYLEANKQVRGYPTMCAVGGVSTCPPPRPQVDAHPCTPPWLRCCSPAVALRVPGPGLVHSRLRQSVHL